ncbi:MULTISPECIES: DUF7882 family protein [unclassified Agromyces]|uniref:DUF7882 family protein n=1 Tax=unclassified Agromyces TaxID=2639701 RepID=UPI003014EA86
MGSLTIAGLAVIELDDDLVAHLHAVLVAKLRRGEPVLLEWTDGGEHAQQIWVHPSAGVLATYDLPHPPDLDRRWLDRLMIAANSVSGISIAAADLHRHTRVVPCATRAVMDGAPRAPMPVAATASPRSRQETHP